MNIANHAIRRRVHMATDHPLAAAQFCLARDNLFITRQKLNRLFDFEFKIGRERPIRHFEKAPDTADTAAEPHGPFISLITQFGEPRREVNNAVKFIAVQHEIFFSGGRNVNGFMQHGHAAKTQIHKITEILIVIAGNINQFGTFARFTQKFLHHVIVALVPHPLLFQRP